jgi:hypothetical protein
MNNYMYNNTAAAYFYQGTHNQMHNPMYNTFNMMPQMDPTNFYM